jgi:uroporphyrinogen decarboxylase
MYPVGCNLLETGNWLRGMENFLVDIYTDLRGVERLFDYLTEGYLEFLRLVIEAVGNYVDILMVADDLGSQNNSLISPEIFRKVLIPRYRKMYDYIHGHCDCKIFLHSCGSIANLLPDLIDIGLDIINPVQTTAASMEPETLKREFGRDLVFWGGGSNTRDILPHKSPQEVREDVKWRIEILGRDGGFVFNPIHNIMADVPPENVIAMYDAAYEFGKY